jgi:hypothetical protein
MTTPGLTVLVVVAVAVVLQIVADALARRRGKKWTP